MSLEKSSEIEDEMNGVVGGGTYGYRNGHVIYQSTTEPTAPPSMLDSMKRVFGQVVGSATNGGSLLLGSSSTPDTDNLLLNGTRSPISIIGSR